MSKLRFLPGTSEAEIEGDAGSRVTVPFEAREGQRLTIDMRDSPENGVARLSAERLGDKLVAVSPRSSGSLTIPATGEYLLVVDRVEGVGATDFSATVAIH